MNTTHIILLIIAPLSFLIGKIIAKVTRDEITEVRFTTTILTKIIITILTFITTQIFFDMLTTIIITILVATYLCITKNTPKEKVLLAIMLSTGIIHLNEIITILGFIGLFFWGLSTQKENEEIITKHTAIQTGLFMFLLSFKFLIIDLLLIT
jgi:hypothetical protein